MAILAAVDENERSKRVVEVGYDLATTYQEPMVVLHVIPAEDYRSHQAAVQDLDEFSDFSLTQEQESAERFARRFVEVSIDQPNYELIDPRGRVGNVVEEILNEAEELDPRFMVISGRRRSPAGKAIFGNTAQRLLLGAYCPVVTIMGD